MPLKIPGIQGVLHELEQGRAAPIIKAGALIALVIALGIFYLFAQFKGLRAPDAMDQAQIGRSIAAGEGFSTKYVRPLAVWQLQSAKGSLPEGNFPDINHQPLYPTVLAIPQLFARNAWQVAPNEIISSGDRMVAAMGITFFLAAMAIFYFVGREMFDRRVAGFGILAAVLADLFWQFSLSGLPQMFLLLLFAAASLLSVQALRNRSEGGSYLPRLLGAAALFGLMALTHGLAVWIFLGWLLFWGIVLRRHPVHTALLAIVFALVVSPWMIRNQVVCGNPFGLNIYSALWPGDDPERNLMRQSAPNFRERFSGLRSIVRDGAVGQLGNLFKYLGMNIVAAAFFLALLHSFRSQTAAHWKWGLLSMWIFAALGMGLFGLSSDAVSSNQLHVLFVPMMAFYGMAFFLVLWNRLDIHGEFFRRLFLIAIVALCAVPMFFQIFFGSGQRIQWPPYLPPFYSAFTEWFQEDEVLCSDMPWALAWYTNRKCVLLPERPATLIRYHDYRVLGGPISALYLTPLSMNQPLLSQIYKGTYREWAGLITRPPQTRGFFLPAYTPLPLDGECVIFADSPRWQNVR